MATKAQPGNGAVVSIGSGTTISGATWTPVGEVAEFNQSGSQMKTDDATSLSSVAEEFIPTILSPGKFSGSMNYIAGTTDAGQVAVRAAWNATPPVNVPWQVQLAKNVAVGQSTAGDKIQFLGLVEEFSYFGTVKPDKKVSNPFAVKISGGILWTAGS
jgi:hypothetical protein